MQHGAYELPFARVLRGKARCVGGGEALRASGAVPARQNLPGLRPWKMARHTCLGEVRPPSGWSASLHPEFRERVLASEQRTGQRVERCDHFSTFRGVSGGLLTAWFYYDASDMVIDADFPYQSD